MFWIIRTKWSWKNNFVSKIKSFLIQNINKFVRISILTGLYGATSGTAYINGKNISNEMNEIRKEIGICPQFDIQWDTLTPYEHVIFYARLKGISKEHEKQHSVIILYFLYIFWY